MVCTVTIIPDNLHNPKTFSAEVSEDTFCIAKNDRIVMNKLMEAVFKDLKMQILLDIPVRMGDYR